MQVTHAGVVDIHQHVLKSTTSARGREWRDARDVRGWCDLVVVSRFCWSIYLDLAVELSTNHDARQRRLSMNCQSSGVRIAFGSGAEVFLKR